MKQNLPEIRENRPSTICMNIKATLPLGMNRITGRISTKEWKMSKSNTVNQLNLRDIYRRSNTEQLSRYTYQVHMEHSSEDLILSHKISLSEFTRIKTI